MGAFTGRRNGGGLRAARVWAAYILGFAAGLSFSAIASSPQTGQVMHALSAWSSGHSAWSPSAWLSRILGRGSQAAQGLNEQAAPAESGSREDHLGFSRVELEGRGFQLAQAGAVSRNPAPAGSMGSDARQERFWRDALNGVSAIRGPAGVSRAPGGKPAAAQKESARLRPRGLEPGVKGSGPVERRSREPSACGPAGKPASPFVGPAEPEKGRGLAPDFDGRSNGNGFSGSFDFSSRSGAKRGSKPQEGGFPRFKPPKLKDWIGKGALAPPGSGLTAPDFTRLKKMTPRRLPDGGKVDAQTPPPAFIEGLLTPDKDADYSVWKKADGIGRKFRWHASRQGPYYYHRSSEWGVGKDARWSWMILKSRNWWAAAGDSPFMVRHADHWWWRTRDGWFLLHQGEPWGWRHFADWKRAGLIHPRTGTRIVYSEDGRRVAVVTPGEEWAVFDAATGQELARGLEEAKGKR
ncbi:MAG: hypothetical protein HY922_07440 [Elusimicrobia bacterium]|nr:hypothetical protein [Elusimicrobiota bacterium]